MLSQFLGILGQLLKRWNSEDIYMPQKIYRKINSMSSEQINACDKIEK